jgi:hypothetical protein
MRGQAALANRHKRTLANHFLPATRLFNCASAINFSRILTTQLTPPQLAAKSIELVSGIARFQFNHVGVLRAVPNGFAPLLEKFDKIYAPST